MGVGKLLLIGISLIAVTVIFTSFGLSVHNITKIKKINDVLKDRMQLPTDEETVVIYVYDISKSASSRNAQALEINSAIIELFDINLGEKIDIDISLGYDSLIETISEHIDEKNIIILTYLASQDVTNMMIHIDKYENWNDIFYIVPTSTADNSFLNSNNVMRLYQKDNEQTAATFVSRAEEVVADHTILIVDEEDLWASGLANLIESVSTTTIERFPFRADISLPSGSLNVILLSLNAYPLAFDILKDADIRSLTLGDGSYTSVPSTQTELDHLINWNTYVMVYDQGRALPKMVNDIKRIITDKTIDLSPVTITTSAIQAASYLKNVVRDRESFSKQYHIAGLQFDEELSARVKLYYGCKYSEVGLYANIVDNIYPVDI